ncbi:MAG: hypothetical protein SZ59_C0002G0362 [candidate division TM6 bacterium GW2011_GWF2_28_16]|nr:MAG: hypothetical protein SZ59_C0002G0362 [candidate division TM6 bacterium GW2011_GWF2_28_16]
MIKKIFLLILFSQIYSNVFCMQDKLKKNCGLTELHFILFDNPTVKELESGYSLDSENLNTFVAGLKRLECALSRVDIFQRAPFFMCFLTNNEINLDLIVYLMKKKAPIGSGALDEKYKERAQDLLSSKDIDENNLFHYAAYYKHLELIEFFCKNCEYKDLHMQNKNKDSIMDIILDTDDEVFIKACWNILIKYFNAHKFKIEYYPKEREKSRKICCCEQF